MFEVTGVSNPTNIGIPSSVTIRVVDWQGKPLTGYTGRINFSSTDQAAMLPQSYTMKASDNGVKTFVNGVTMRTQGNFCVSAQDSANATIKGAQCEIEVGPASVGAISKLAIITPEQSFPSNGYSSPITVQTQAEDGAPIAVTENTTVYLYTDSATGQFSLSNESGWSSNKPFSLVIPAGLTAASVYYRDPTAQTSQLAVRDLTTDAADNGLEGDFGWHNATQGIVSGVGAPTRMKIYGPERLDSNGIGEYTVEIRDDKGNPVTAENDIRIRVGSDSDTSKFYLLPDTTPLRGPIEITVPAGSTRATVGFSDVAENSQIKDVKLKFVDGRPMTESVRLEDADYDVRIGLGDPYAWLIQAITDQSVRKFTDIRLDATDEFGNITYPTGETLTGQLSSDKSGRFASSDISMAAGMTGASAKYLGLEVGVHTIKIAGSDLVEAEQTFEATPIAVKISGDDKIPVKEKAKFRASFIDQNDQAVVLDEATEINLSGSATTGTITPQTVTIAASRPMIEFEYIDTELGERKLTAESEANGVGSGDKDFEVVPGEYNPQDPDPANRGSIKIVSEAQTLRAGERQPITFEFRDKHGTPTVLSEDTQVRLISTSTKGSFSSDEAGNAVRTYFTVPADSDKFTVYYYDEIAGSPNVTVIDGLNSQVRDSQRQTVVANIPAAIELTTDPQVVVKNTTSEAIGGRLLDQFGNLAKVETDDFEINLSDGGQGGEFSRNGSSWSGASFRLNRDAQTFSVYYRNENLGVHTLEFASQDLAPASQIIDVIEGYAAKIKVTPSQDSVSVDEIMPVEIQLLTEDGNPTVATKNINLRLGGDISLTETPFTPITGSSVLQFRPREGAKTVYFRSTVAGTREITASDRSTQTEIEAGQATVEVLVGEFARFGISPGSQEVPLGATSGEYTVSTYDIFGNIRTVDDETDVYLYSNSSTTEFAKPGAQDWNTQKLEVATGDSTVKFVARDSEFVDVLITASDAQTLDNPDTGIANGTTRLKTVSQPIERIRFTTPNRMIRAGEISEEITIQLEQADGSPAIQEARTIYLKSSSQYSHKFASMNSETAIAEIEIAKGSSQASFRYSGNYAGTHIITASAGRGTNEVSASQPIQVDANVVDSLYFISPPRTLEANDKSEFVQVGFKDRYGNSTRLEDDLQITLASNSSTAKFSSDFEDWQDTNTIIAKSGNRTVDFYLTDITSGVWQINLRGLNINSPALQNYTVTPGAPVSYKLVGQNNAEETDVEVKGAPYRLRLTLYDEFGNISPARTTTRFNLLTSSSTGKFTPTQAIVYAGMSTTNIQYVDVESGENKLTIENSTLGQEEFNLTYTEGEVSKLKFNPASATIKAGGVQKLTLTTYNQNDVEIVARDDLVIDLASDRNTGKFMLTSDGEAIDKVTIPAGRSSIEVLYTQTQSVNAQLTATRQGLEAARANLSVLAENVAYMALVNQPYSQDNPLQIGQTANFRVQLYDIYGNQTTTPTALTLYATSNSGVRQIRIPANSSSAVYNLTEEIPGDYQITISTNPDLDGEQLLVPVQQDYKVVYGAPTDFAFDKSSANLERGATVRAEAKLLNAYKREVPAGENGAAIRLRGVATSGATGEFALQKDGNYSATLELLIPEGEFKGEFYYRNDNAAINSRVCYVDAQDVRNCYTIATYNHHIAGVPRFVQNGLERYINIKMQYGAAVKLEFTTPESTQTAHHPSSKMTVQRVNQYGIPVPANADQKIYLRSSNGSTGEFSQKPQEAWGTNYVILRNNNSSVDFYYRDGKVGEATITAADLLPIDPDQGMINAVQKVTIERQEVDHLFVTNISDPQSAGTASSVVVMARDAQNFIVDWYDGTIRFTSDDPNAILPGEYTFNPEIDKGSKTFTNQVAFRTAGEKIVYATDIDNSDLSGAQTEITVENGNTEPVASLEITQPESPVNLVSGVVSSPITIAMKDADGKLTNAQAGGQPVRLASSSWSAKFALSPNGPWVNELVANIPEGLSFLNFYYQDTTLGKAQIISSDWTDETDNQDIENAHLEVEIARVGLSGSSKVYSQNVFGEMEESKYLFSAKQNGEIIGRTENEFDSYSLQTNQTVDTWWRLRWSQGVNRIDDKITDEKLKSVTINRDIQALAGQPDFYATAESTDVSFSQPESVVSLEHTIPTSPWRINLDNSEYVLVDQVYQANIQTFEYGDLKDAPRVSVKVLPAGATNSNDVIYSVITAPVSGQISTDIPAEILSQIGDRFQLLVEIVDENDDILAQALSSAFEVVEEIPQVPVEPEQPVDPKPVDPEKPVDPVNPGAGNEPQSQNGGDLEAVPSELEAPEDLDEITTDQSKVADPAKKPAPNKADLETNTFHLVAPAAILTAQVFFLVIALLREAYKEVARVHYMRKEMKRLRQIASDKEKFLTLSSHYLRSPIALLEAVTSISPSARPAIKPILSNLQSKSEQLIEKDIQPELDLIKNPNIAKATRSALKSIFFWLPIIASIALTVGINLVIIGLARGVIQESLGLYIAIAVVLGLVLGFFWLRTNHINKEHAKMQKTTQEARRILFANRNKFMARVRNDLGDDIKALTNLSGKLVLDNQLAAQSIRESAFSLSSLSHKLQIISQLDGAPIRPTVLTGSELAHYVANRYRSQLSSKNIKLNLQTSSLTSFKQDDLIVRSTLDSLIEQAIKVTPVGGEIAVELTAKGDVISITVDSENLTDMQLSSVDEADNDIKLDLYFDQMLLNQIGGEVAVADSGRKLQMKFKSI